MSNRFQTVRDILDHLTNLHRTLAARYGQLADAEASGNERVSLVLRYLERHEQILREALLRYGEDASPGILATWFDSTPDLDHLLPADIPVNDVNRLVAAALAVDEQLLGLYRQLAAKAENPSIQELFEDLARQQSREEARLALAALQLSDV